MISSHGNLIARCTGAIAGVVTAVPQRIRPNLDWPEAAEAAKMTGVLERRIAGPDQTTETLCLAAARRLLVGLDWAPSSIEALVYVTQTPSMAVPAAAYDLHSALGLPAHCPAIEVNWSCAGYVYGLWLAMKLGLGRVLLLVGDTSSRIVDPEDRATAPLFGDAGSATAIQADEAIVRFVLGSDGQKNEPLSQAPGELLRMDGASVFGFTLRVVPGLVDDVLAAGRPDFLLFHQANRYMLGQLAKKTGLQEHFTAEQIPSNIDRFGNCSSASIPLLLCDRLGMRARGARLALFGYGAGWAWAGATIDAPALRVAKLVEV